MENEKGKCSVKETERNGYRATGRQTDGKGQQLSAMGSDNMKGRVFRVQEPGLLGSWSGGYWGAGCITYRKPHQTLGARFPRQSLYQRRGKILC